MKVFVFDNQAWEITHIKHISGEIMVKSLTGVRYETTIRGGIQKEWGTPSEVVVPTDWEMDFPPSTFLILYQTGERYRLPDGFYAPTAIRDDHRQLATFIGVRGESLVFEGTTSDPIFVPLDRVCASSRETVLD